MSLSNYRVVWAGKTATITMKKKKIFKKTGNDKQNQSLMWNGNKHERNKEKKQVSQITWRKKFVSQEKNTI